MRKLYTVNECLPNYPYREWDSKGDYTQKRLIFPRGIFWTIFAKYLYKTIKCRYCHCNTTDLYSAL